MRDPGHVDRADGEEVAARDAETHAVRPAPLLIGMGVILAIVMPEADLTDVILVCTAERCVSTARTRLLAGRLVEERVAHTMTAQP